MAWEALLRLTHASWLTALGHHRRKTTPSRITVRQRPLAHAASLAELADVEWATTSITLNAEEEFSELFRLQGLRSPRLALQSQSALTLIVSLACTDLLAMVPVQ